MQQPIQLTIPAGAKIIEAYGADGFTVSGEIIAGNLFICASSARLYAPVPEGKLTPDYFSEVFLTLPKPNLLLFGTGQVHRFVSPEIRQYFRERSMGFETMDTGSAVRTYNILLAEGREVAGLFLKIA